MKYLIKLLDKTEISKYYRFFYYLFFPIFYFIELICFFYFWNKIKNELLTNEEFVTFLDDNEFGYKWYKLYKMDIIEKDNFLDQFEIEEIALKIKAEFIQVITEKISKITVFDIEEYININVLTTILPENKIKKYTVEIKYYRFFVIQQNIKYLIIWTVLISIITFLLINVNFIGYIK